MTEILEKKQDNQYTAQVKKGKFTTTQIVGPQQLGSPADEHPLGTRITKYIDSIDMKDTSRFVKSVERYVEELKLKTVKMEENLKVLENHGAHEIGPVLEKALARSDELKPTKAAHDKFTRKFLKVAGNNIKQWQAHKSTTFELVRASKELENAEKHLAVIKKALNGTKTV